MTQSNHAEVVDLIRGTLFFGFRLWHTSYLLFQTTGGKEGGTFPILFSIFFTLEEEFPCIFTSKKKIPWKKNCVGKITGLVVDGSLS